MFSRIGLYSGATEDISIMRSIFEGLNNISVSASNDCTAVYRIHVREFQSLTLLPTGKDIEVVEYVTARDDSFGVAMIRVYLWD